jgi:hypothetical protein
MFIVLLHLLLQFMNESLQSKNYQFYINFQTQTLILKQLMKQSEKLLKIQKMDNGF